MAKYTTGSTLDITRKQLHAIQLKAEGWDVEHIAMVCFNVCNERQMTDKKKLAKAVEEVKRWFADPKIVDAYNKVLGQFFSDNAVKAAKRLAEQLDSKNEWVVNKAANDILTRSKIIEDNKNAVTVKVEGMPVIGVPDE